MKKKREYVKDIGSDRMACFWCCNNCVFCVTKRFTFEYRYTGARRAGVEVELIPEDPTEKILSLLFSFEFVEHRR